MMWSGSMLAVLMLVCLGLLGCVDNDRESHGSAAATGAVIPGHTYYVVGTGQTLDDIARIYHASPRDIVAANRLTAPYALKPGMMLEIPIRPGAPVAAAKPRPKHAQAKTRVHTKTAEGIGMHTRNEKLKHTEPAVIPLD